MSKNQNFQNRQPQQFALLVPMATVANYHKCSALKHHTFIFLKLWRSEIQQVSLAKIKVISGAVFLLKTLEKNPFPCLLQLLEVTYIPCLVVPSSIFKVHNFNSPSVVTFLSLTLPPSSRRKTVKPTGYSGILLLSQGP